LREGLTGVATSAEKFEEVGSPGELERLVIEFAKLCHDSLNDWSRAGRLCTLIIVAAVDIAMIPRAAHG
jgi:hypothetical protein